MGRLEREQARHEELLEEIRRLRANIAELKGEEDYLTESRILNDDLRRLREDIETVKLEKLRLTEEHALEIRETQHAVGLERMRQEFEAEQKMQEIEVAKREALVELQEKNLAAEREAFEKQLEFITDRMTGEVETMRELMGEILGRLPDVTANYEHGTRPVAVGDL